jgi:hypothetical protein
MTMSSDQVIPDRAKPLRKLRDEGFTLKQIFDALPNGTPDRLDPLQRARHILDAYDDPGHSDCPDGLWR